MLNCIAMIVAGAVKKLALSELGVTVLRRLIKNCHHEPTLGILVGQILLQVDVLASDPFGCYVVQVMFSDSQDVSRGFYVSQYAIVSLYTYGCLKQDVIGLGNGNFLDIIVACLLLF